MNVKEYAKKLEESPLIFEGNNITNLCKQFLGGLLEKNISKRFSFEEAVNHSWIVLIKEKIEEITSNYQSDPEKMIHELNKCIINDDYFEKKNHFLNLSKLSFVPINITEYKKMINNHNLNNNLATDPKLSNQSENRVNLIKPELFENINYCNFNNYLNNQINPHHFSGPKNHNQEKNIINNITNYCNNGLFLGNISNINNNSNELNGQIAKCAHDSNILNNENKIANSSFNSIINNNKNNNYSNNNSVPKISLNNQNNTQNHININSNVLNTNLNCNSNQQEENNNNYNYNSNIFLQNLYLGKKQIINNSNSFTTTNSSSGAVISTPANNTNINMNDHFGNILNANSNNLSYQRDSVNKTNANSLNKNLLNGNQCDNLNTFNSLFTKHPQYNIGPVNNFNINNNNLITMLDSSNFGKYNYNLPTNNSISNLNSINNNYNISFKNGNQIQNNASNLNSSNGKYISSSLNASAKNNQITNNNNFFGHNQFICPSLLNNNNDSIQINPNNEINNNSNNNFNISVVASGQSRNDSNIKLNEKHSIFNNPSNILGNQNSNNIINLTYLKGMSKGDDELNTFELIGKKRIRDIQDEKGISS